MEFVSQRCPDVVKEIRMSPDTFTYVLVWVKEFQPDTDIADEWYQETKF